jgi:hypothetical protein
LSTLTGKDLHFWPKKIVPGGEAVYNLCKSSVLEALEMVDNL